MTVLQICPNEQLGTGDLAPPFMAQLHRPEQALDSLIYAVLFTNARVTADSQLPPGEIDRGGHWADMFYPASFGSLLWTLKRESNVAATWRRAQTHAQNALERWISSEYAKAFAVTAGYAGTNRMYLHIVATLPDGNTSEHKVEVALNAA